MKGSWLLEKLLLVIFMTVLQLDGIMTQEADALIFLVLFHDFAIQSRIFGKSLSYQAIRSKLSLITKRVS